MNVYAHEHAIGVQDLHQEILLNRKPSIKVGDFIKQYAHHLQQGFKDQNRAVFTDISNYYKPLIGKSLSFVFDQEMQAEDFLNIAANVHGFANFEEIGNKEEVLDLEFEKALDMMLQGNLSELDKSLKSNPKMISQHSQFGHKAQLIHYCGSNAVEIYRQVVPRNLLEIIKLLISKGADPKVKIPVYGGEFDFFELFSTSAHPKAAGVDTEIYGYFSEKY